MTDLPNLRLGVLSAAMQLKPKQTFKIGDTVELETEWLEGDLEAHYWVLTIHEIFRSEEVMFSCSSKEQLDIAGDLSRPWCISV